MTKSQLRTKQKMEPNQKWNSQVTSCVVLLKMGDSEEMAKQNNF